jgi:hypothetical protein
MRPARSLQALLSGSIDYAGMFPPCQLELEDALRNYANYTRDPDRWMLSAFVLPVARFADAGRHLDSFDRERRLRVSALGAKAEAAEEFAEQLRETTLAIRRFETGAPDRVAIEQLEMLRIGPAAATAFHRIAQLLDGLELRAFWEAPASESAEMIADLAKATIPNFGFKLRTGGVTADAFPGSVDIARVLIHAAKARVPIKFTAGLHHPVRMFREEVKGKMHGFLNVLGAAVLAFEHQWNEGKAAAMLEDEDPGSFSFNDERFAWREWSVATERIEAHRRFVTSFGSCSFEEPREDLRALNLL